MCLKMCLRITARKSDVVQPLTDDIVSTVGAGVMLEQPGVHTLFMKSVSTGDDPQLLEVEKARGRFNGQTVPGRAGSSSTKHKLTEQ